MLNYSKVEQLLKKEFPSITQEKIDHMISTLPKNMPYSVVKILLDMTKYLEKHPELLKLLKLQTNQNAEDQIVSQNE